MKAQAAVQPSVLVTTLKSFLDENQAIDVLRKAVAAASITGAEAKMVEMLHPVMERLRLSPIIEEFLPGRPNIYGVRTGENSGPRLAFLGHTDVVHAHGWSEHWKGKPQEDPFAAAVLNGEMWGRGVTDLKAGICSALLALDLVDRAGFKLYGQVSFAFVGDEESGEAGSGISAGIKAYTVAVKDGRRDHPDFAIYVEPTKLAIYPVQMGFFIADITFIGESAYFGKPELGRDALKAAHSVLTEIWTYSEKISERAQHPLLGRAFVLVTEVKAGGLIAVPGECRVSLIRKLLPSESLDDATKELENLVRSATPSNIDVSITYPAGRDHERGGSPGGTDESNTNISRLASCIKAVREELGSIEGAPFWSEMPFLTDQLKCPTVYFAPGDISICHTNFERVPLRDYFDAIVGLAAFIITYCGIVNGDEPN